VIGDKDPEDAYDAGDPVDVRIAVLQRIVDSLIAHRDERTNARRADALRVVLVLLDELRYHRRRIDRIRNDLEEL
jgi:hypothetical protein